MNEELPESADKLKREKLSQIIKANETIEDTFDDIDVSVEIAKKKFVHELNVIKSTVMDATRNDDNKEDDILNQSMQIVNEHMEYLHQKMKYIIIK